MTIYPTGPQDAIKYVATAPDGSRAAFNDPTDADYVGMAYFSGLEGPDIREAIDPRTGTDGAIQGLNFRDARAVVGTVEILASSTADRNAKSQKLRRAMNALRADGTLDFTPDGGLPNRVYYRLSGRIARNDERGWKYVYQFPLKCADPSIYGQTLRTTTVSTAGGGDATITNQGDGVSAPTISVTMGSASTVTLINNTTGETIVLGSIDPANLISFVSKFGVAGSGNSNLSAPRGVTTDSAGNVYVCDAGNHVVKKFNSSGIYQQTFGIGTSTWTADGHIKTPLDVAVDAAGNVYVLDPDHPSGGSRVQKFNSAGVFQAKNSTVMGVACYGLTIDATPSVFVTDYTGNKVWKYANTLGASSANFGTAGTGNGQFAGPMGIACDSTNQPWVVDQGNKRVQKFSNAATPVYVSQFSTVTGPNIQLPYPLGIDGSNNVYVGGNTDNTVGKWNSSGTYQTKFGTFGTADGQFNGISGLDGRSNTLWVSDQNNNREQQFSAVTSSGVFVTNHGLAAVTTNTGVNLYQYVDVPNTIWWGLAPGDNSISVAGSGVTAWTISWRDAWQ